MGHLHIFYILWLKIAKQLPKSDVSVPSATLFTLISSNEQSRTNTTKLFCIRWKGAWPALSLGGLWFWTYTEAGNQWFRILHWFWYLSEHFLPGVLLLSRWLLTFPAALRAQHQVSSGIQQSNQMLKTRTELCQQLKAWLVQTLTPSATSVGTLFLKEDTVIQRNNPHCKNISLQPFLFLTLSSLTFWIPHSGRSNSFFFFNLKDKHFLFFISPSQSDHT